MEFRIFGELRVRVGGRLLDPGTPRQQTVLAALLVDAGRPVPIETLVDRVWDDDPPPGARNVLYSHLSRIRHLLRAGANSAPPVRLDRRHAGYLLELDRDLVDLHRFQRLLGEGSDPAHSDATRAAALAEALALWEGVPLAGLTGRWVGQLQQGWQRRRLAAVGRWAELELRLGHPDPVSAALADLTAEHPLDEPIEALLMRALHAAGRGAEAVQRYAVLRRRLADELGTDPGAELRTLHRAILRGELPAAGPTRAPEVGSARPVPDAAAPTPTTPATRPVTSAAGLATPAQLPPDSHGFVGRGRSLRELDGHRLVFDGSDSHRPALRVAADPFSVCTVSGTAGVGKTALAVHWAHRVRDRFPDGQLYVNLRGFAPAGEPMTPGEAVRGFLDALAVPAERVPAGLDAQVGLYRSLLAGRRVLVLLDNARDAEQVRPLLPGAAGCLAVVTSRDQLVGLVAEGAHPLNLDLLSLDEARQLLARRLGTARVTAEPEAVDEIADRCARLPLALAIVAARAATHPGFRLAVLADELRTAGDRLAGFTGADPATDVPAAFSWSYRQLGVGAARLFRLLGLHPGPDVGVSAAARLAGRPARKVRPLLAELARAHLLTEHRPGRYTCHDLLRAYAAELAEAAEPATERHAAVGRLLAHYLHTAYLADRLLNPHRDDDPTTLDTPPPGGEPELLTDHAAALTWFGAEHAVLSTVVRQLRGFDAQIWQLAWTLTRFHSYQGHWHDSVAVLAAALGAAGRLDDPRRQAYARRLLGCAHIRLGRYRDADGELRQALTLYRVVGESTGEAHAHRHYAWMLERQGRYREALAHAGRAHHLFRTAGHRTGQARAENAIGWFHALLGDHRTALAHCAQALDLQEQLGDRFGQAETWDSIGFVRRRLGWYASAVGAYRQAVALYREFDDHFNEADSSVSLGDVHLDDGDLPAARAAWQHALAILERLGDRQVELVRARLGRLAGLVPSDGSVGIRTASGPRSA